SSWSTVSRYSLLFYTRRRLHRSPKRDWSPDVCSPDLSSPAPPDTELPDGWLHCTSRWILDAATEEMLGFIATRHRLNDVLLQQRGHIAYSARPSARRHAVAAAALHLAPAAAPARGMAPELVTFEDANHASRRTAEEAGGVREAVRAGARRYWLGAEPLPSA